MTGLKSSGVIILTRNNTPVILDTVQVVNSYGHKVRYDVIKA